MQKIMNNGDIWSDKDRVSGKPCITNTRMPLAQLLAEVADGATLREIADRFRLEYDLVWGAWVTMVNELCLLKIDSEHIMRNGVNCLRDTEIPVSYLLMNLLIHNTTPKQEVERHALDQKLVDGVLCDLAVLLDRDWSKGPPEDISKAIREGPT